MVTGEGGLAHTNAALTTNSARRRRIGPGDAGIQRFLLLPAHLDRACARGPRTFHDKFTSWGEYLMNGLRYDRILAGTALALILAIPMGGLLAQDPNKIAPAPTAAAPVEQTAAPAPAPPAAAPGPAPPARGVRTPTPARRSGGRGGAARPSRSSGSARPRRPRDCGKDARPPGRDFGQNFCQQERARGSRGVLPEPQLPAALA